MSICSKKLGVAGLIKRRNRTASKLQFPLANRKQRRRIVKQHRARAASEARYVCEGRRTAAWYEERENE